MPKDLRWKLFSGGSRHPIEPIYVEKPSVLIFSQITLNIGYVSHTINRDQWISFGSTCIPLEWL